jgi:natural product precursor
MKKIEKLTLHQLGKAELDERQMNVLRGGAKQCACVCPCVCGGNVYCGCLYAGPKEGPNDSFYGGSSTSANSYANYTNAVQNTNSTDDSSTDTQAYSVYNN